MKSWKTQGMDKNNGEDPKIPRLFSNSKLLMKKGLRIFEFGLDAVVFQDNIDATCFSKLERNQEPLREKRAWGEINPMGTKDSSVMPFRNR